MILKFMKRDFEFKLDLNETPILNSERTSFYLELDALEVGGRDINLSEKVRRYREYRIDYYMLHKTTGVEKLLCLGLEGQLCKEIATLLNMDNTALRIILPEEYHAKIDTLIEKGKEMVAMAEQEKIEQIKEADSKIGDKHIVEIEYTGKYRAKIDGALYGSFIVERINNKFNKYLEAVDDAALMLDSFLERKSYDGYQSITYYKIPYPVVNTLLDMIDRFISKETSRAALEEELRLKAMEALIQKAKETGRKQFVEQWSEPCNDPEEECNFDMAYKYVDADGKITVERQHTW